MRIAPTSLARFEAYEADPHPRPGPVKGTRFFCADNIEGLVFSLHLADGNPSVRPPAAGRRTKRPQELLSSQPLST